MGIGNQRTPPRLQPPKTAHYPSWGSGTTATVGIRPESAALITPHGDRELGGVWSGRVEVELITPHGDRERCLAIISTRIVFMAHYPSWGSGTPEQSTSTADPQTRKDGNSLPLMGIGNMLMNPFAPAAVTSHYPSWGSGTPRSGCWWHYRHVGSHYPSWGSGTYDGTDIRMLITPHGDREPPKSHYPSWGSGCQNYPSWGSGTPTANDFPHYPSWGSGTCPVVTRLRHPNSLITPHGDREPG